MVGKQDYVEDVGYNWKTSLLNKRKIIVIELNVKINIYKNVWYVCNIYVNKSKAY